MCLLLLVRRRREFAPAAAWTDTQGVPRSGKGIRALYLRSRHLASAPPQVRQYIALFLVQTDHLPRQARDR
jgi:hypothetical protein